ncbi:MAG: hypothetical protein AAGK01_08120 [Pseudomonadota bacterium]
MQAGKVKSGAGLTLRVSVFGELRVTQSDGVPATLNNRRATFILAILCLQPEQSINRAALAKLLWPDRFDAQAKASLRQCLMELRRSLDEIGVPGLSVTRSEVAMGPEVLSSDLSELEAALENAPGTASDHLLAIGSQTLLQDSTLNPELVAWLAARRKHVDTRLKTLTIKALETLDAGQGKALLDAARSCFPGFQPASSNAGRNCPRSRRSAEMAAQPP